MKQFFAKAQAFVLEHKKITISIVIIIGVVVIGYRIWGPKASTPQYQTDVVTKGTLITSVSASGSVSVANKVSVTTQASGAIDEVFVKNGDIVSPGQTIATVKLDQNGQQKQAAAWAQYLTAQNSLAFAQATQYTLQNQEFVANQKFMNDAVANGKPTADPLYVEEQATWLAAEASYKNQAGVISQAESTLTSASLSYQAVSSTITAPVGGMVTDLTLTPGMQISGSNGSSSANSTTTTTNSGQAIASIKTSGAPVVSVSIAEVDIPKVQVGQKATLTFDALPNKTFTGKIIGINTTGTISSGVTTYPATITLDTTADQILPNMSTTANIITKIKDNVLLVPSAAIQTTSNGSAVRILQNGKVAFIPVTVGDSSDAETEIISGLTEGQTIVTSISTPTNTTASGTSSPFSGLGGRGGFGGGNATFIRGAGGGR